MSGRKKGPRSVSVARSLGARFLVTLGALAGAALFGSQVQVRCQRVDGRVNCQVRQGTQIPGTTSLIPFYIQEVQGLREVRWQRSSPQRRAGQTQTFERGGDSLLMSGDTEIEVGWREAASPVNSFLHTRSRTDMEVTQPLDPRGWLVSRALFAFVLLIFIDSAILVTLGQKRIYQLVGAPPDPDAPLPDTPLARFGQYAALALGLGVLAFFAFGHRYVGPTAEHKVRALMQAVESGDLARLQGALDSGVSVNAVEPAGGGTALHAAARLPSSSALRRLLAAGASAEVYDHSSSTPLLTASGRSDLEGITALLERGADPNAMDTTGWTPLRRAAESKRLDVVELLLQAGADPTLQGPHGWTPLHDAAAHGGAAIASRLLEAGADPAIRNENGHRPWDLAPLTDARDVLPEPAPE